MSFLKNKVFWTVVAVQQIRGGFGITLDGRRLKTPAKSEFSVPTRALAEAIAAEWQTQSGEIDPATMPMTRRANAAIDKVTAQRAEVADMLAAYGASDLLCYRADYPEPLRDLQAKTWTPLLEWVKETYNAPLHVATGIMPHDQDDQSLKHLTAAVHEMAVFPLTGFHDLVTLSGSLVIGLAAISRYQSLDDLWQAACLDEIWQAEQWGVDEAAQREAVRKRQDFLDAHAFIELSQTA